MYSSSSSSLSGLSYTCRNHKFKKKISLLFVSFLKHIKKPCSLKKITWLNVFLADLCLFSPFTSVPRRWRLLSQVSLSLSHSFILSYSVRQVLQCIRVLKTLKPITIKGSKWIETKYIQIYSAQYSVRTYVVHAENKKKNNTEWHI